jgi:hypothetical protein
MMMQPTSAARAGNVLAHPDLGAAAQELVAALGAGDDASAGLALAKLEASVPLYPMSAMPPPPARALAWAAAAQALDAPIVPEVSTCAALPRARKLPPRLLLC